MSTIRDLAALDGTGQVPVGHPRLAERFLRLFLSASDQDPVLGDLVEMFEDALRRSRSARSARIWYWRQALQCAVPFLHLRCGRLLKQISPLRCLAGLGRAIAGYYLAVVLLGLLVQLPHLLRTLLATETTLGGIGFSNGLLVLRRDATESASLNPYVVYRSWGDAVTAAIIILGCLLVLRFTKGWSSRVICYLIIATSSYRLMPPVISRLVSGGASWIDIGCTQAGLAALRTPVTVGISALIVAANYFAFRRLSRNGSGGPALVCVGQLVSRFLLPVALVSVLLETAFLSHWNPWAFEYRTIALVPVFAIGVIAAIQGRPATVAVKPA